MYVICDSPEKGRCVIATQHLCKGKVIIKESPFLMAEDVYDAIYQLYEPTDDTASMLQPFESLVPHAMSSISLHI